GEPARATAARSMSPTRPAGRSPTPAPPTPPARALSRAMSCLGPPPTTCRPRPLTAPEPSPKGFPEPFPKPFQEGSLNPFHQPISDPNPNPKGGDSQTPPPKTTKQQVNEPQQAAREGFPEGFPEGFREGFPEGSGVGVGVGVKGSGSLLVQERPKTTSSGATAPHTPPITAQTLIGEWLDRCPKRPPSRVIGHVAKEI